MWPFHHVPNVSYILVFIFYLLFTLSFNLFSSNSLSLYLCLFALKCISIVSVIFCILNCHLILYFLFSLVFLLVIYFLDCIAVKLKPVSNNSNSWISHDFDSTLCYSYWYLVIWSCLWLPNILIIWYCMLNIVYKKILVVFWDSECLYNSSRNDLFSLTSR